MNISEESIDALFSVKAELSKIKKIDLLDEYDPYYPDLCSFIDAYLESKGVNKILVFGGSIGSGKTRSRRLSNRYRGLSYQLTGEKQFISIRTWEHAERESRERGFLSTPKGLPLEEVELGYVADIFTHEIADAVWSGQDAEIEAPILTSTNTERDPLKPPKFTGRDLGLRSIYNLKNFLKDEFLDLPNMEIWAVGISGGPHLRYVAPVFKDAIRGVETLREGQALALLCGLEPPKDERQLRFMQLDGASLRETAKVRSQFIKSVLPIYRNIRFKEFASGDPTLQEGGILWHLFTDTYNLSLPVNRVFVGKNEPDIVIPQSRTRLLADLIESQGRLRLTKDQVNDLIFDHVPESTN